MHEGKVVANSGSLGEVGIKGFHRSTVTKSYSPATFSKLIGTRIAIKLETLVISKVIRKPGLNIHKCFIECILKFVAGWLRLRSVIHWFFQEFL